MTTFIKLFLVFLLLCGYEIVYSQTEIIYEDIINSSPPLVDFVQLKSAKIDPIDLVALKVPSYLWSYGCASTSAAMLIGYYDQGCFPSLYTGLKNGGMAPFNNSFWRKAINSPGILNYDNSISASMNGYDQQGTNGHFDDFWECSSCGGDDPHPYIGSTPPHNFSLHPCVGDFMGTSQDYFNNLDGSTRFYNSSTNSKVINYSKCESETPKYRDGNYGLRKFIESCHYTVEENFNQNIAGLKGVEAGFTYDDFKNEIDAGRPVLIHFKNHTAIGFGYSYSNCIIRIYTTWSEEPCDIVWGSDLTVNSAAGPLAMLSVSVIKLNGSTLKSACMIPTGINDAVTIKNPPSGTIGMQGIIPNNTNLMTPCTNASFWADFQTDHDPTTYANTFDWKIVLYHSGGEYVYAQQNGILPNTNTPNSSGQGCVWQPSLSGLPAYNWSIDYSGNIYGKVSVIVHKDDGVDISNEFEIGVHLYSEIKDITYAVNTTINATCTKLNLTNVGITSPASVTVNSNGLGIGINGTFVAQKGSTLTINK